MPFQRYAIALLPFAVISLVATARVGASSPLSALALLGPSLQGERSGIIEYRDEHEHTHDRYAVPLLTLNETEISLHHAPTPPSYWSIDIEDRGQESRYPGLMALHVVFMCLAFFGALPVGIAMRSVKHSWHGLVVILFYGACALGCAASALYTKLTPNMYQHSSHPQHGYFLLLLALSLSLFDLAALFRRTIAYLRSNEKLTFRGLYTVILGRDEHPSGAGSEYTGLVVDEPEEFEESKFEVNQSMNPDQKPQIFEDGDTTQWANEVHHSHRRQSSQSTVIDTSYSPRHSEDTLHDILPIPISRPKASLIIRIGRSVFATLERILVFGGFMQVISGITVYTGGCRENYINGCLAHLIKGGIFWCYGLVTFARFLGSFSETGWAWNRVPSGDYPSAEFVESLVIFIYGVTNTWMERWGAKSGDPFTTKQVQHIGIAVMFWFAGLVGMGIESKRIRRWMASSSTVALKSSNVSADGVAEPPSYIASFNPFPALVIGVTGAAMAAHAQTYLFQVQIHELWGNLLLGFSVMRCLTYFFLWLSPPRSILPSRPPTEALGSFFLACGGLVFMFSTEEVTIAAMRKGRDDVMMFLNVAVAITCFAFCWALCIVAFKGWLKSRIHPKVSYHSSA